MSEPEEWLRETLRAAPAGEPAIPFAVAVLRQLARAGNSGAETARAVVELLQAAGGEDAEPGAERLAHHHPMLAAFFQNADLLYEYGYAGADAVSSMVLHALHLAVETEPERG